MAVLANVQAQVSHMPKSEAGSVSPESSRSLMERSDSDLLRTSGLGSIEMMPPSPFAANSQDYVIKGQQPADVPQQQGDDKSKPMPQRMVSWQDDVMGRELVTIREFEPSEGALECDTPTWQQPERKSCCSIM